MRDSNGKISSTAIASHIEKTQIFFRLTKHFEASFVKNWGVETTSNMRKQFTDVNDPGFTSLPGSSFIPMHSDY
jgi:hypothetical protein